MDLSALVAAVDFGDVGGSILAISALMCACLVVVWGARKVLAFMGHEDDPYEGGYGQRNYETGEMEWFDSDGNRTEDEPY